MTPEQLEIVFDTLDVEQKGYLTLDQFLEKFSEYTSYDDIAYTRVFFEYLRIYSSWNCGVNIMPSHFIL